MNEANTRKDIIDLKLQEAGWNINDLTQVVKEYDIKVKAPAEVHEPEMIYNKHQFSDYVLLGKNGKPLAVIEAKKTSIDPKLGREQAKQYCYNIIKETNGDLQIPVILTTQFQFKVSS